MSPLEGPGGVIMPSPPSSPPGGPPPRLEPPLKPVNGIVQPPFIPPPERPGRMTNKLLIIKNSIFKVNHLIIYYLGNLALPRLLLVTPAVYLSLVLNYDFSYFSL